MRRRPARSFMDRVLERMHGPMVRRVTRYDYVQWLDWLGADNDGMVPATADCAESIRRHGSAARAQIDRERVAAWRRHGAQRAPRRLPRGRARRHRVARRAAAKAAADPDGPAPRAPFADDLREAPRPASDPIAANPRASSRGVPAGAELERSIAFTEVAAIDRDVPVELLHHVLFELGHARRRRRLGAT